MNFREYLAERKTAQSKDETLPSTKEVQKVVDAMPYDTSDIKVELRKMGGAGMVWIGVFKDGKQSELDKFYDKKEVRMLLKALQKKWSSFDYGYGGISIVNMHGVD